MVQTETMDWRLRWVMHPIARALALSMVLHLGLFFAIEVGSRYDLWRFSPLAFLARIFRPAVDRPSTPQELAAKEASKPEHQSLEVPLLFMDVDASQATPDAPEKAAYYASVNSRAANPDTSRSTAASRIDGEQDKVLKTADTPRPAPVAQPLRPAAPPPAVPALEQARVEPLPPQPVVQPKPQPPAAPPPGDIAMAKPSVTPAPRAPVNVSPPAPTPPPTPPAQPVRPRTLAAAQAQAQQGQSALMGQRMKQEGGVKRFSIQASVDTRATPLGVYDARFIQAVQRCWYDLLDAQRYSLDRVGKVVLEFRLTQDGRITGMKVLESDVGDIYTTLCQLSITKPAPYEKWPPDMRRMVGTNYRDVRFTFYY